MSGIEGLQVDEKSVTDPRPLVPAKAGTAQTYFSLIKPRVIPLLLVPTVAAMLMAEVQEPAAAACARRYYG